jgi:hypothetical protein
MFELNYKIKILNDKNTVYSGKDKNVDDIEGVAMWFINHEP